MCRTSLLSLDRCSAVSPVTFRAALRRSGLAVVYASTPRFRGIWGSLLLISASIRKDISAQRGGFRARDQIQCRATVRSAVAGRKYGRGWSWRQFESKKCSSTFLYSALADNPDLCAGILGVTQSTLSGSTLENAHNALCENRSALYSVEIPKSSARGRLRTPASPPELPGCCRLPVDRRGLKPDPAPISEAPQRE
jgi:hypothetical protein